jgi:hypothetical protein
MTFRGSSRLATTQCIHASRCIQPVGPMTLRRYLPRARQCVPICRTSPRPLHSPQDVPALPRMTQRQDAKTVLAAASYIGKFNPLPLNEAPGAKMQMPWRSLRPGVAFGFCRILRFGVGKTTAGSRRYDRIPLLAECDGPAENPVTVLTRYAASVQSSPLQHGGLPCRATHP